MGAAFDVSLVSSGHDLADARLHRLASALHDAGLTVEVIGLGDPATGPSTADAVVARSRRGAAGRAADAVVGPWRARGKVIVVVDPDSVPSAWLRRLAGRRLVVDVHEDYAALLRDRSWATGVVGGAARAGTSVASALARRADLTVVADSHVPPGDARHRLVLRNMPYGDYLPDPTEPDPSPRALYVGDLRRSRGLFDMVEAVALAPGWTLDLVGPVASADEARLTSRLASHDVAGRVRLLGRRPPAEAWRQARGAWVGLSLLSDTPAFRDAVPTKVYEYLSSGLPVVASRLPRQAALIEEAGAGSVVLGPAEAAAALAAYVDDPRLLQAQREAARAWTGSHRLSDAQADYVEFAASVRRLTRA